MCQPASSPDTNVLDLGIFASCQSRQLKHYSQNFNELIDLVQKSFDDLEEKKLAKIWHTLASTKNLIIEQKGNNDYALPRSGLKKDSDIPAAVVATPACIEVAEWVVGKLEDRLEVEKENANNKKEQFAKNISLLPAWKRAVDKRDKTEKDLIEMSEKRLRS